MFLKHRQEEIVLVIRDKSNRVPPFGEAHANCHELPLGPTRAKAVDEAGDTHEQKQSLIGCNTDFESRGLALSLHDPYTALEGQRWLLGHPITLVHQVRDPLRFSICVP
jgi:hypothetical protein